MKWVFNLTKHKYESSLTPVRVPQASVDNHTYTYNSIGKLATINQDVLDYELTYGVNEQRIEAVKKEYGQVVYTKQYINSVSMETKNGEELTYLYAEGQPFAIHKKTVDDEMMYYLHLDHLGSIMSITDQSGIVVETRSYDAWGRPQDPNTWSYQLTPFGALNITDRGYTFHEHLIEFSLINMNGRMYDPVLGRVISPDNYIQAPDNTQSFNRYSYCFNNPLKYSDPSGDIILETMIVAGMINLMMQTATGNVNSLADMGIAFGIGAAAGATGYYVGAAAATTIGVGGFLGGAISGAAGGATGAFVGGTGNAWMNGKGVGVGLQVGLKSALWGGVTGGIIGGTVSGIKELRNEKSFWNGKIPPKVYRSPVGDNFGRENGECVLRCFEEFSRSYGVDEYNYKEWFKANGHKLGVSFREVDVIANKSTIFGSEQISPDINSITSALSKNQRVLIGFAPDPNSAHAVMVSKVKVWSSGQYRIWFSETSSVRLAPYSTDNLWELPDFRAWNFYLR